MARVNASQVKDIIDTDLPDITVSVFINAANITVTKLLGSSTVLSATQLKEIERWLTAHLMACTRERQSSKEEVMGETSITYTGKTGEGLKSTFYGQTVLDLDTSGVLAKSLGKKLASLTAVPSFE
jgi:hypothetical protein